jgi:Tat protein translocase TatC
MAPSGPDDVRMTLGEHLEELRRRVLYALLGLAAGMTATLIFCKPVLDLLQRPYVRVVRSLGQQPDLGVIRMQSGMIVYMKVGLIGGLILSAPWVFYHLWQFVAAGLYPHERKKVLVVVPFSAGLFVAGALFYLLAVSEALIRFFLGFNEYLGLTNHLMFPEYIGMITGMMLVFGLGFQIPIVVWILGSVGLIEPKQLGKYRPYVIVILLVFSALVTSPSPVDQVLLAVPMWLLYELGALLVRASIRKRPAEEKE